jgi:hypothetical protein
MLSVLINTHMLMMAREAGVERFFAALQPASTRPKNGPAPMWSRRRAPHDARGQLWLGKVPRSSLYPGGATAAPGGRSLFLFG